MLAVCVAIIIASDMIAGGIFVSIIAAPLIVGIVACIGIRIVLDLKFISYLPAIAMSAIAVIYLVAALLPQGEVDVSRPPSGWGQGGAVILSLSVGFLAITALLIAILFEAYYSKKERQ